MPLKKILLLILCINLVVLQCASQDRIRSLKDLYLGIPVQAGFDNCQKYISGHPLWGIDSIGKRGIYSSFKQGKDHFPFPDSVSIRLLLAPSRAKAWDTPLWTDSTRGISIEAVLGNHSNSLQTSVRLYKELRKMLKKHYKKRKVNRPASYMYEELFSKGRSKDFPDCILVRGFEPSVNIYFVVLEYWGF